MSTVTLADVSDKFPPATSVSLYGRLAFRPGEDHGPGAAPVLATASVAAGGSLTFSGVASASAATMFYAYAFVSGQHRRIQCGGSWP